MNTAFMSYAPSGGTLGSPIASHSSVPGNKSIANEGLSASLMIN
jgi:hypothetical protein